jgi:hypothetical protein
MHRSTSRLASWVVVLGTLVAVPAMAVSTTITSGSDIFSTSTGTVADFAISPLPAGFFCTGSSAFSGTIPLTGVPLTTVPAGIAGTADTIVERLANGVFSTSGTTTIPVILRAMKMRSASNLSVSCSGVGTTHWQVDVCLCGTQTQTSITASIDPACGVCGTFNGLLSVNACLRFTRLDNGDVLGPVAQTIRVGIVSMPWCYQAGARETVVTRPFTVDTDCNGTTDRTVPATSNFHPGWSCSNVGQDCWTQFASLTHCHPDFHTPPSGHLHCVNPVCGGSE